MYYHSTTILSYFVASVGPKLWGVDFGPLFFAIQPICMSWMLSSLIGQINRQTNKARSEIQDIVCALSLFCIFGMATMFETLGSERTLADHLLPLLSSLLTIVHTSHVRETGPELKSPISKTFNNTRYSNGIHEVRMRHLDCSIHYVFFLVISTSHILELS